jgi:hypothetical protein
VSGLLAAQAFAGLQLAWILYALVVVQSGLSAVNSPAVGEGLQFIRRSQVLAGTFLADLNATVLALPIALFPAINAVRFGGNPATLGLFVTAIGVGGVVSSAFTGPLRQARRSGLVMLVAVSIWGAAFAGFALAHSLWLTLTLLAVAGAAGTFSVVLRGAIVQEVTTDALRGRLTSAEYVSSPPTGPVPARRPGQLVQSPLMAGLVAKRLLTKPRLMTSQQ